MLRFLRDAGHTLCIKAKGKVDAWNFLSRDPRTSRRIFSQEGSEGFLELGCGSHLDKR